jgi:para-aminobenzoate synthetase component 1
LFLKAPLTSESEPSSHREEPHVSATISRDEYLSRVRRIKEHVHEGDIYQANFTSKFEVATGEQPFDVYSRLRQLSPAPYAAFLNFGDMQTLSSSPERMLLREGTHIITSPIKGTIVAGETAAEIEVNRQRLLASAKDRAELLMIVDLERNDLGKVARTGSVRVDSLFRTELYRSLIHLVSDVSAEINDATSTRSVLQALLPGGSITGAPKLRAIEILQQLEETPRGLYTGCIGYMKPGRADFNIAIRTIVHQNSVYHVHAGGGIVADSSPEAEYEEMLLKASNMFRALGLSEDQIACLHH